MKKDYSKMVNMAKMSMENATYFAPFAPTGLFKSDKLKKLPSIHNDIVDLSEALQGGAGQNEKYE